MHSFLKCLLWCAIIVPLAIDMVWTGDYNRELEKYFKPEKIISGIKVCWTLNHECYNLAREWGNALFKSILWPFEILSFLWAMVFFIPWRTIKFLFCAMFKSKKKEVVYAHY